VAAFGGFSALAVKSADAAPAKDPFSVDYGPLQPVRDQATGQELLMLPKGFEYISYSWRGDPMSNGNPTPAAHDGMAAFRRDDRIVIVRNHEVNSFSGRFTDPAYDPDAAGGTSNLVFDPDAGRWLEVLPSVSGTIRNCAGGPTPWGSWLTCEETGVINPVSGLRHGYVLEVPIQGQATGTPFKPMGRFSHEAVAVDSNTGWVYETEDANPAGLFRFRPNQFGNLASGGTLEMLSINTATGQSYDARQDGTGTEYTTSWVTIDNPDPQPGQSSPTQQGLAKGAAIFRGLEGIWFADGVFYIVSTNGGPVNEGQIFEYHPSDGSMRVLFASPSGEVLDSPDNITVSPRGGIVLCEDGGGIEFLHGLTQDGQIFKFCQNNVVVPPEGFPGKPAIAPGNYTGAEFAGATFEPKNGNWLFVNIQSPGITFAITGPWRQGAL
jgi:secreted PhoX family phosphatase